MLKEKGVSQKYLKKHICNCKFYGILQFQIFLECPCNKLHVERYKLIIQMA